MKRPEQLRQLAAQLGDVWAKKNEAYGDSLEKSDKMLALLFPDGVEEKEYWKILLLARIIDKLGRIANDQDAFGEDPWADLAGYAARGQLMAKEKRAEKVRCEEKLKTSVWKQCGGDASNLHTPPN